MASGLHSKWADLVTKSLEARLSVDRFAAFADILLKADHRVPKNVILRSVLQSTFMQGLDPIVPQYVNHFLTKKWILESDLLQMLLENYMTRINPTNDEFSTPTEKGSAGLRLSNKLEEVLFGLVSINLNDGQKLMIPKEAHKIVQTVTTWLTVATSSDQMALLDIGGLPQDVISTCVALGLLIVSFLANQKIRITLDPASGSLTTPRLNLEQLKLIMCLQI